jgi:CheY-specific phosphatase CheX
MRCWHAFLLSPADYADRGCPRQRHPCRKDRHMSSDAIHLDHELATVINVIEECTVAFLRDQFGFVADRIDHCVTRNESVVLRSMTAIVGVGSGAGLYIAYSYDDSLIRAMPKLYTAGLSIASEEEELYLRETASDIVNVIVGNSTANLARRGEIINLSPPVLMVGARTIQGRRDTAFAALTLSFSVGVLDVMFVGPKSRFDDHLIYQKRIS